MGSGVRFILFFRPQVLALSPLSAVISSKGGRCSHVGSHSASAGAHPLGGCLSFSSLEVVGLQAALLVFRHARTRACMPTHTRTHAMRAHTHTHTHTHTYACMLACEHAHACACSVCIYACRHGGTCTHTRTHAHAHTDMHAHTHTQTRMHAHTSHTYTHTQSFTLGLPVGRLCCL